MDDLTAQRVYDIADKLRELADELDGGYEADLDSNQVKVAVLDLLSLMNNHVPGDTRWNNAVYEVLKAIGQNPSKPA
jgi:hypothetical protein